MHAVNFTHLHCAVELNQEESFYLWFCQNNTKFKAARHFSIYLAKSIKQKHQPMQGRIRFVATAYLPNAMVPGTGRVQ